MPLDRPIEGRKFADCRQESDCRENSRREPATVQCMVRPLVDFDNIDLTKDVVSEEELREVIPHRHEFQLIDGICHLDLELGAIVAYKDFDENAWWARGHIPGNPVMPGVLLIEGGAQVATYLLKRIVGWPEDRFIGLGGLNNSRFRGQVVPPARVYFLCLKGQVSGKRLAKYPAQAICNGKVVMETEIMGLLL